MRNAVVAAAVLLSASTALAQPGMTTTSAPPPYYYPQAPAPEVKSESTATLLSIGATLGGLAVMSAGAQRESGEVFLTGAALMVIGPSAGHFYAGETGHGVKMSLLRTGAALVFGVGVISQITGVCDVAVGENGEGGGCGHSRTDRETGEKLLWIGGGAFVAATLYDFWDAHNAAHRANVRAARRYTIAPSIMGSASGTRVPGIVLAGQF